MPAAGGSQSVALALAPAGFVQPATADQPVLLELVQDRIEGAVVEAEGSATLLFELQGELISMVRPG